MKLMDRYIVRELIVPFLAGSIIIALIFDANQLIYILKQFNSQVIPVSAMLQMILFRTPYWLNLTLPMGIALASSLAITRLARESEITAMRAGGVRMIRIVAPVAFFGLVVAVGNYLLVEKVIPRTEQRALQLEVDSAIASGQQMLHTNVWITLKGGYSATFQSIERQPDDSLLIKGVALGQRPAVDTVTFITAPSGTYKDGIWKFQNVTFWQLSPIALKLTTGSAREMIISQPIFINDMFDPNTEPQNKTLSQLSAAIKAGKAANHDMTQEEIQYYERFSAPFTCIIYAVVCPIFAVMFARSGSFAGLMLSFILVMLNYNAFVVSTEIFGRNHWFSPWLAAWAPNFIFAALGLLGVRRLE